jgi:hypothetical protein
MGLPPRVNLKAALFEVVPPKVIFAISNNLLLENFGVIEICKPLEGKVDHPV